jgi:hypothetical protein
MSIMRASARGIKVTAMRRTDLWASYSNFKDRILKAEDSLRTRPESKGGPLFPSYGTTGDKACPTYDLFATRDPLTFPEDTILRAFYKAL